MKNRSSAYIKLIWSRYRAECLLIFMLYICIFISGVFAQADMLQTVFLLYLLTTIYFMPGYILVEFIDLKWKSRLEKLFFAFAIGVSMNILLYLFLLALGLQKCSRTMGIVLSLIGVACMFVRLRRAVKDIIISQNSAEGSDYDCRMHIWILISFAVIWIITFFTYQMPVRDALITGKMEWQFQDNVYWLRNTAAALKGYPVSRLSTLGLTLHMHYFSNLQIAFLHYVTGIEIADLSFSFSYVWSLFLLSGGMFCFFNELLKRRWYVCLGMISTLLTTGTVLSWTHISYLHHIYIVSFGFTEAYALALYAFIGLYKSCCQRHSGKKELRKWTVMLILFAVTLGAKLPLGCIVLAGAGCICLYVWGWKQDILYAFAVGAGYLAVFVCEYIFIYHAPYNSFTAGSVRRIGISLTTTLKQWNELYIRYQGILTGIIHSRVLSAVILSVIFLFMTNFIMNYYLGISMLSKCRQFVKLRHKTLKERVIRVITKEEVLLYFIVIISYVVFIVSWQDGYSQAYLIFNVMPYGLAAGFIHLENTEQDNRRGWTAEGIGLMLVGIGIVFSIDVLGPSAVDGVKNLFLKTESTYADKPAGNSLTREEEIALRWARDHTSEDAVFVTNKLFCCPNGEYSFVSSAYAQRQMFLEGYAYEGLNGEELGKRIRILRLYYTGDNEGAMGLKEAGVDYALVFMNVSGYTEFASGNVVFDNGSVKVVQLKQ